MSDYDNQILNYEPIRCDNGACYNEQIINDLQKRIKELMKIHNKINKENKRYSKELCDIYEIIKELLFKIDNTCFPVQLIKQDLKNIIVR